MYGRITVLNINEDREAWLKQRGIGSSDISVILGSNPYGKKPDLIARLRGSGQPIPQSRAMKIGHLLEDDIVSLLRDEFSHYDMWQPFSLYCHPTKDFATASPDVFFTEDRDLGAQGIMELKAIGCNGAKQWSSKPPLHYVEQLKWQLGVIGLPKGYLVALLGGQELRIYQYSHDEEWFKQAMQAAEEFWNSYVLPNKPLES